LRSAMLTNTIGRMFKEKMKEKRTPWLEAALALMLILGASAAHADLNSVRTIIGARLNANKQPFSPSSVNETLLTGLYRWNQGAGIGQIYVNEAVTLMLLTDSVKITQWDQPVRNPTPISDDEKYALLDEMLKNIRFDQLIHIAQGNGSHQVLLLSAFDCPYCIALERMLATPGNPINADIYILPTALQNTNAKTSTVANIWCAQDNAAIWRTTLVKEARGYFVHPGHSCDVGVESVKDIEVILHSIGGFHGYPFMVMGNGQFLTPSANAAEFAGQLNSAPSNDYWTQRHPDRYRAFRAEGVSVDVPTTSSTQSANAVQNLFQLEGKRK
jgi:hypothetical protein